jgi:RNA ligase
MTAVNEGSEDERESTGVEGFVKFPRTPHLVWLGKSSPRGDKLMAAADADEWLRQWCYAELSVYYDALPDWFLLFDVYDRRERRFWSRIRRDEMACAAGLVTVPLVATAVFRLPALRALLDCSHIGSAPAEGVYLRWDDTGAGSAPARRLSGRIGSWPVTSIGPRVQ